MVDVQNLKELAQSLVAKGILAADESLGTIQKRFDAVGVENSLENRRSYREMLFTTKGIEEFLSGVILFEETLGQGTKEGTPFPKLLADKGIIPGIKIDKGKVDLLGYPGEFVTEGLDGLAKRLEEYKRLGAKFTKWRAVFKIGHGIPTRWGVKTNAHCLARFAKDSQEMNFLPVIEPEVLMDGDHPINQCQRVTEEVLKSVFSELLEAGVNLEALLLKANMVIHGEESLQKASAQEVAEMTIDTLLKVVPAQVPGIVFLSGGQSPEEACLHLSLMNKNKDKCPWELSFSYGRALQGPALRTWSGRSENLEAAQKEFYKRAKLTFLARKGEYYPEIENE